MSSAFELQKQLQIVTDEVKDIFHATSINISALGVQMEHKNTPRQLKSVLANCAKGIKELEDLMSERATLRLNYLIIEQIKEEEAKVRRERLNDYEEKILDQRRLISDKEAFYENLFRPKKKRPPSMPIEEFQELRRREIAEEESTKYEQLKQEVGRLEEFYLLLKSRNDKMETEIQKSEQISDTVEKRTQISDEIERSETLYNSLSEALASPAVSRYSELFQAILRAKSENEALVKECMEEKEMEQYLNWEKQKLVKHYQEVHKQYRDLQQPGEHGNPKQQVKVFDRPVSR